MTTPINPTAVYPPGYYPPPGPPPPNTPGPAAPYSVVQPNFVNRAWNRIPQQNPTANIPRGMPQFLRSGPINNRSVVFNAWMIAMIVVGFDEWHNLGILPRPARLWDTSLVYGLLVMLGFVDAMVPIANALAIGYTFQLIWQYFQGNLTPSTGQGPTGTSTAGGPVSAPPPTPGANFPLSAQLTGQ
jgi:hypothetical protein